jgi:hypothetical protein
MCLAHIGEFKMKLEITRDVFKAQAQKQLAALRERNIELKLSDIQESLAQAYGHANLATLYAVFKQEENFEVDAAPLRAQKGNLFVVTWVTNPDDPTYGDDVMAILPPGTTLNDFSGRGHTYEEVYDLLDTAEIIPTGLVFSEETVVLESYAWAPRVSRYGFPDSANEATVAQWVKDWLGFRVPKAGVEVSVYDMGDDTAGRDHLLLWLNDEDCAKVRAILGE